MESDDNCIIELETRIAFQDQMLSELSATVYRQQLQLDTLREKLDRLIDATSKFRDESNTKTSAFEIPPHY